jgi:hypothetical protein
MASGMAEKSDIAFFKFCFVDITRSGRPTELFEKYTALMDELSETYAETEFMHVTIPLCSLPSGGKRAAKSFVKRLLGKERVAEDNAMREKYNDLLRKTFGEKGDVFDLALVQTIDLDGFSRYVNRDGREIPMMVPGYTTDGGHLTRAGGKRAAEQLLIALARVAGEQR